MNLFLDANAHLPMNSKALKAYQDFINSPAGHGHPSSPSEPGRLAATALEESRAKIASLIGAESARQIIFTSSCTQAAEWGIKIFLENSLGMDTYSAPIEHPAVRDAFLNLSEKEPQMLEVNENGTVIINEKTNKNIICIHLQNEIGTIQPIEEFNSNYLFSDISQSLGKIPVNVTDLKIDIAIAGAHKFAGPGGVGFIYLKNPEDWSAFGSGSRYFLDRPGTPDVAGIVATAAALEESISTLPDRTNKMTEFQTVLENYLKNIGVEIIGVNAKRSPNTTFIHLPDGKGIQTCFKLGQHQIYVGLGSACGSVHAGPSHVIKALGKIAGAHDFLRISQYGEYGEKEANHLIKILEKVL